MGSPLADLVDRYAELATGMVALATRGALQALSDLAGALGTPKALTGTAPTRVVLSETFASPLPGAPLELVGALVDGHASDRLERQEVIVELTPDAAAFRLRADAAGHRGATYWGSVTASPPKACTPVPVWITVP